MEVPELQEGANLLLFPEGKIAWEAVIAASQATLLASFAASAAHRNVTLPPMAGVSPRLTVYWFFTPSSRRPAGAPPQSGGRDPPRPPVHHGFPAERSRRDRPRRSGRHSARSSAGGRSDGLVMGQLADGPHQLLLVLRVHIGRGLVENDDGGVLHDGPGDGDPLAFAAGEGRAANNVLKATYRHTFREKELAFIRIHLLAFLGAYCAERVARFRVQFLYENLIFGRSRKNRKRKELPGPHKIKKNRGA